MKSLQFIEIDVPPFVEEEAPPTGFSAELTQVASATSTGSEITGPSGIQAGDLLVLYDVLGSISTPTAVVPSDFTIVANAVDFADQGRLLVSYKIADGSEGDASLLGMSGPGSITKLLYVFRGNGLITAVSGRSVDIETTAGNPTAQVVTAGSGVPPLIVFGAYSTYNAIVNPRTFSTTKDGEINVTDPGGFDSWLAYKIYNAVDSAGNTSVDMDDEGVVNFLTSFYLQVTVQDPDEPEEQVQTFRFAVPTDYIPKDIDCIPSIATIAFQPAVMSLGEDLGERATLTITLKDHKHIMNGEPFDQGTFFGKFRARYGQKLRGRSIRWVNGLLGTPIESMPTRHFFVERTDGPSVDGVYTIVAKDLLKFADDERAKAPVLSNGKLAAGIDTAATSITLLPEDVGGEYPGSGYVCIGGKEIVSYTKVGDDLTITRAQLGTSAQSHSTGDRVQLVLYYDGDDVADIIYDLFTNYANIDPDYIPLADWQAETAANLGSVIYARAITEPTPVNKLVSELIDQAALCVWWSDTLQIIRLLVLKEIATDAALFDEETILKGSLKVKEQPDKRISQVWTYYGQRNPTDRGDDEDNYRAALVSLDSELEAEYGSPIISTIKGQWIATENAASRLNQVKLSRFRNPPRQFNFDLFPGTAITPGNGYRLRWRQNQDVEGNIVEEGAPIQITRLAVEAGVIHIEAEEMLASGVVVLTNVVILTTTGSVLSWTVPDDWNDADNSIEVIGAGGTGGDSPGAQGGAGGGGGGYSKVTNLSLTPAALISYRVGANSGGNGGDTWFNGASLAASSVGAKGGTAGGAFTSVGIGGQASSGIGTLKRSGGNGGRGSNNDAGGGGGGGGAGGPNGNGGSGDGPSTQEDSGGGGGGADGGGSGGAPTNPTGGNGGSNRFGSGGGNSSSPDGVDGGGGKGGDSGGGSPGTGSAAGLWTQTIAPITSAGPAGGAGGGAINENGRTAANYGGGGGGAGSNGNGGRGSQGVIIITWTPA